MGASIWSYALEPQAGPAAALEAMRLALQPQLRASPFAQPLYLHSREGSDRMEGDVYAEVGYSLAVVGAAFESASTVCELLFLHLNVRACQPSASAHGQMLTLMVGPKRGTGVLYPISYALRVDVRGAAYRRVTLTAANGPLSTRDYRIVFEAAMIDADHSFVHLSYAYGYGAVAKLAMQMYLATAGRSKIGFSVIGQGADGRPRYVRGERASLERNVIRYYLALLAYSSVNTGSPQERRQARLRAWFALTERYAAQLHELDLAQYLHEKSDDLARTAALK